MKASRLIRGNMRGGRSEDMAERLGYLKVISQVNAEVRTRYPAINVENVQEVIDWKEARIKALICEELRASKSKIG